MAVQIVPGDLPWEVLIIDNASSDNTAAVAASVWQKSNTKVPLRVVSEPKPGLSFARARGVAESAFDTIIFCDDDNWLCDSFVSNAWKMMDQYPQIGGCGGLGEAYIQGGKKPEWFDRMATCYALGPQGEQEGPLPAGRTLFGAGLVLRKSVLDQFAQAGFQTLLSDRKGSSLSAGGDSEISEMILLSGFELWYNPRLTFTHYIEEKRLNISYLKKLMYGFGVSLPYLETYKWVRENKAGLLSASWLFQFIKAIFRQLYYYVFPGGNKMRDIEVQKHWGHVKSLWQVRTSFATNKKEIIRLKSMLNPSK